MKSDYDIAIRTIVGEARGEDIEGQRLVAHVIRNRAVNRYGGCLAQACLQRKHFSCWNVGDPNRDLIMDMEEQDARYVTAQQALFDALRRDDPTRGATHYMTKRRREKGWPKSWGKAKTPCHEHGDHLFYNDVD